MTIFIPWWPLSETCARWGKGAGEAESRRFCNCSGRCGVSLFSSSRRWFTAHPRMVSLFLPPFSPFFNTVEEFFSSWSLWPPSTWSDVPLGCNECWMSGHICRRLPGMDRAYKNILSQVYCKRDRRCDVEENLQKNHMKIGLTWPSTD